MRIFTLIAGIVCLVAVLLDAFQTIILPRRATGRFRLTRMFYVATWKPWRILHQASSPSRASVKPPSATTGLCR